MALPIISKNRSQADMLTEIKDILCNLEGIDSIFMTGALASHIEAADIHSNIKSSLLYMVEMYKTYDNS